MVVLGIATGASEVARFVGIHLKDMLLQQHGVPKS